MKTPNKHTNNNRMCYFQCSVWIVEGFIWCPDSSPRILYSRWWESSLCSRTHNLWTWEPRQRQGLRRDSTMMVEKEPETIVFKVVGGGGGGAAPVPRLFPIFHISGSCWESALLLQYVEEVVGRAWAHAPGTGSTTALLPLHFGRLRSVSLSVLWRDERGGGTVLRLCRVGQYTTRHRLNTALHSRTGLRAEQVGPFRHAIVNYLE